MSYKASFQNMSKRNYSWVRNLPGPTSESSLSKNAFVSILCSFFNYATRFFIPPIILHYVPIEVYGIWSYTFIFINYYAMSSIGISNVYTRYVAIYQANHETSNINKLLTTGLLYSTLICSLVILGSWNLLPYSFPILQIPANLTETAFVLIFGTIAIFSLEMTLGTFKYVLHGLQKVGVQWMIITACQFMESILIVLFLYYGYGIYSLLYAYLIRVSISNIAYAVACRRYLKDLSIGLKWFSKSTLKIFFHFGGIVQIRSMLGIVNRSLTRLFSGIFLGSQATAMCDLGEKFPITITAVPMSALFVFLPASSHFHAKGDFAKIRGLYLYGSRYMSIMCGLMLGFLAPFSSILVTGWLGPDPKYQTVAWIIFALSLPYHILVVTGPASAAFRSINLPAKELWYGVFEIVLAIMGGLAGVYLLGGSILAIVITISATFLISSGGYLIYTNAYLKIRQKEFLSLALIPGLIPYALASLVLLGVHLFKTLEINTRLEAFYVLSLSLIAYLAITLPIYFLFILSLEERKHLIEHYFQRALRMIWRKQNKSESTHSQSIGKTSLIWNNMDLACMEKGKVHNALTAAEEKNDTVRKF